MLDLSIIILTRGTCALTCAAIESVLESRDTLRKEILLVDNGGDDGTAEVVELLFPSVRLVRFQLNLGFARATNLAAQEAQGRYLLLLHSDARVLPDALGAAVAWMETCRDCGVAGAQLLNPDGSPQESFASRPTLTSELLREWLGRHPRARRPADPALDAAKPFDVEAVSGAFLLTRRLVWDVLRGLDERYFFFWEELDFCLAVQKRNWRVMLLPQVRVRHLRGGTAGRTPAAAVREYWRSRYAFFEKHHGYRGRSRLEAGLKLGLAARLACSGLVRLATLGRNARWRRRWADAWSFWRWQRRDCSPGPGLPR